MAEEEYLSGQEKGRTVNLEQESNMQLEKSALVEIPKVL